MSAPQEYASTQPAGYTNHIRSVALVGATGQQGKRILAELLARKEQWAIHVLTRAGGSATDVPSPVHLHEIDYDSHGSIVSALKGVDILIITLAVTAPGDTSTKLITAAKEAGVKWIVPNEWSTSGENVQLEKDIMMHDRLDPVRKQIVAEGLSYIAFATGFWYEYSLGIGAETYGFDFANRQVIFFDGGDTKICTSTWEQVARGVAKLLSLPILPNDEADKQPTISQWRNRHAHVASFIVSQKDMLESVERVTGTTDSDWKIVHQTSAERVESGQADMMAGQRVGFIRKMYSRVFFPTGEGNFENLLDNEVLGLPKEDLDKCTKAAIERFEKGGLAYRD